MSITRRTADGQKAIVLVCTHKDDSNTRNSGIYHAIQVGKSLNPKLDLGFLNDNEGDNISERNHCWCELTALYWGWKNLPNVEYLGLCHYRRYFKRKLTEDNIERLLKGKDMLVLTRSIENCSVQTRMQELTTMEDYHIFVDTLLSIHPEYRETVLKYCCNNNAFYRCTMFVARKKLYDDLSQTMFSVLDVFEKRLSSHAYQRLNRCVAYYGELFLGLYIEHHHLKTVKTDMEFTGDINPRNNMLEIIAKLWRMIRRAAFVIFHVRFTNLKPYPAVVAALHGQGIELEYFK